MKAAFGTQLGEIVVRPPGPRSVQLTARLRQSEQRNITYVSDDFPIFLAEAAGANVLDVDGNVYVDLSGFFGVSAVGHSNPHVAAAVAAQARRMFHGMGDVYPSENKVALAEKLCVLLKTFGHRELVGVGAGDAFGISHEPGGAVGVGRRNRLRDSAQRR